SNLAILPIAIFAAIIAYVYTQLFLKRGEKA
ncbi:PTS sugar transporter subunit IIC, partial [Lacticaseibacillus paracasei]|nr:PTS sugar transporter subunit IIC [Lacticaseibacillus paracasei]